MMDILGSDGNAWNSWLLLCTGVGVAYVLVFLYQQTTQAWCTSRADMTGKTVIITGANSGSGLFTAKELARRNARVILACRDVQKGQAALKAIKTETGNQNVTMKHLDLASLGSVRTFTQGIIKEEERVDVLINNAGVAGRFFHKTEDGFESTFATNYYGPFLLTNILLGLLKKSAPSRIVNVGSVVHKMGRVNCSTLEADHYNHWLCAGLAYCDSKLALAIFTVELSRRLKGSGVTANYLHPGTFQSHLLDNLISKFWPASVPIRLAEKLFFKTTEQGSQTTIHCAVAEELEAVSGQYFVECKVAPLVSKAQDEVVARQLWDLSVTVTGLDSG